MLDIGALTQTSGLLKVAEVAALFRVTPATVVRWEKRGRLPARRTPGGHRRFAADDVRAALEGDRS